MIDYVGTTDAPVIAERTLTCVQDGRRVTARVHAPERVEDEDTPWCCCFALVGLGDFTRLDDDEVYTAVGRDAFEALAGAIRDVRNVLDRARDKLGLEFSWAHADEEGWHAVPQWVSPFWGRVADGRLNEAVEREETAMHRDGIGLEPFRRAHARVQQQRIDEARRKERDAAGGATSEDGDASN